MGVILLWVFSASAELACKRNMRSGSGALSTWGTNLDRW